MPTISELTGLKNAAVAKDWTQSGQNYFGQTQTISLTLFAIIAGAIVLYTRRYKWLLLFGLLVRLFGVGLMIHSKGAHGSVSLYRGERLHETYD